MFPAPAAFTFLCGTSMLPLFPLVGLSADAVVSLLASSSSDDEVPPLRSESSPSENAAIRSSLGCCL
uniref:Putative secreted protein n=1 Tax=Anopheles darlingi TaxID=43151 RepID=A0A2M4D1W9_ANODA